MRPRLWHPFTQLRGFHPLGQVVAAEGAHLELADGRRVIDGISSWWVNLHGHARPEIAAAIADQARRLDQVILADFEHPAAVALTEALRPLLPAPLAHVFFSDDGSTAVEVALKMAWQHQRSRDPKRQRLVALQGGYHGDTLGAMSVGDRDVFTAAFAGMLIDVELLPFDGPAAAAALRARGDDVVAVILEPMVQCAGGMRMMPGVDLAALAAATREVGALLIADEVAVGMGRTGQLWAGAHAGLAPDLMCVSKGITGGSLPLGLTLASEAIYASFLGEDKRSAFLHGHSYTGNPLACAAAVASLALVAQEQTPSRFAAYAGVYRRWFARLAAHPRLAQPRALGGIFAVDVQGGGGYLDPVGRALQAEALQRGLYLRPLGSVVYLMPPACLSLEALDGVMEVLWETLCAVLGPP